MPAINEKVRAQLDVLGQQLHADGVPLFSDLETELERSRVSGDAPAEARAAFRMATQLAMVAKVVSALDGTPRGKDMPARDDALEPAIDLYARAWKIAGNHGDEALRNKARLQLGDCYVASKQFAKALPRLEETMTVYEDAGEPALAFTTAQLAGDCCLQLERDEDALRWYEKALAIARDIDDPLEIHTQLAKVGSALFNLERYREALVQYVAARDVLMRLERDVEAQGRVSVHKHIFHLSAIPRLLASVDERIERTREGAGRALLRHFPEQMVAVSSAALRGQPIPDVNAWTVWQEPDVAVRAAAHVVANLIDDSNGGVVEDDVSEQTTLQQVGSLAHRYVGAPLPAPESMAHAARYVVQLQRSHRAASTLAEAGTRMTGGAGPSAGSSSHVVYLRSFVASDHLPRRTIEPWGTVDLEELFACGLDRAPLVALGNPELERFGPGRATTTDEDWRAVLRVLATEAQMLLVVPAHTNGTSWEIEWTATNKFLHKTVFAMPPASGNEVAWWTENWRDLRQWAVRLGLNLPEYTPTGRLFRLTTEGQCDEMDFERVYNERDLIFPMMFNLLFRPTMTWDFMYDLQETSARLRAETEGLTVPDAAERAAAIGVSDVTSADLALLKTLDESVRSAMSNWDFEGAGVPSAPGVVLYFEAPFRLLWVEATADLRETMEWHAQGNPTPFTVTFFQQRIQRWMPLPQVEQVLSGDLKIPDIMRFRVRQMVSYRFVRVPDSAAGERLHDLVVRGVSKHGVPLLGSVSPTGR